MDRRAREAFTELVEVSIKEIRGVVEIERTKSVLLGDLERERFNPSRAEELFRIAIDRAIWKHLGSPLGPQTTKSLRGEGIVEEAARRLAAEFMKLTGASTQRPARTGLMAKLIGK